MRSATVFSLSLFPQVFLFQRMLQSDVLFVLTDRTVDERNHVNRCVIRSTNGRYRNLTIGIDNSSPGLPADEARVAPKLSWFPQLQTEVRRSYRGLLQANVAEGLVQQTLGDVSSPMLTDFLMASLMRTLDLLGWKGEVVRGDTVTRRCYIDESVYLLDLCMEARIDELILGRAMQLQMNQRLFQRNEIVLRVQRWVPSKELATRDSILDLIARMPVEAALQELRQS